VSVVGANDGEAMAAAAELTGTAVAAESPEVGHIGGSCAG
jgi:hypothetical protein